MPFRIVTPSLMAALLSGTASLALAQDNPMVGGAPMLAERNIVENAVNSADHTTLVAAVQAAGLVETLQGEGPFTVFAPTNDAFAALPAGTVETLLMPENLAQLQKVLTCHVVGAEAFSDAIGQMIRDDGGSHVIDTLGGCRITAAMDGDAITLTDENGTLARVTIADVDQSNGVIHVIDAVLTPAADAAAADDMADDAMATDMAMADDAMADDAMAADADGNPMVGGAPMLAERNIVENAVNSADHTTLVAAVQAAGLVETLQGEGPFTVFAPTNDAFAALPAGTVETLLMPENLAQLQKVLTAHVVPGLWDAAAIRAAANRDGMVNLQTVSGDALTAQIKPSGNVYVFDESGNVRAVTVADVRQSNGVIHVVDGVLLPR
jgi:transforming growth factor-beta-induced protein